MCVGPKGQFAKNKQKYKVQQQSLNSNIGTCDLAKHMHGKIWDISWKRLGILREVDLEILLLIYI
jgi:hypothetical protein